MEGEEKPEIHGGRACEARSSPMNFRKETILIAYFLSMRRLMPFALAVVLLAVAVLQGRPAMAAAGPTFQSGPCPFAAGAIPAGERVDCGNLVVAEERDQPNGPAIRLAVAILR